MPFGIEDAFGELLRSEAPQKALERLRELGDVQANVSLDDLLAAGRGPASPFSAELRSPTFSGLPQTVAEFIGRGITSNAGASRGRTNAQAELAALAAGKTGRSVGGSFGDDNWIFPVQGFQGKVNLHHGSHTGASDIFAPAGTPVVAARGGQVTGAGFDKTGGNYVSVRGDDGLEYYYAHLDRAPAVKAGQTIGAGTYLGGVGDTGNAKGTGAHLHFGAGRGIQTGVGPGGGAGLDYDTVAALQRALAGGARPVAAAPAGGGYQQMAAEFAREAGIDPNLFVRQIQQESGFNPNARNPSGATGIAQIVPQYHPTVNPNDPVASLRYAAQLMARSQQQYGGLRNALIAYNAGPGGLQRYQRTGVLPLETQTYLRRILGQ